MFDSFKRSLGYLPDRTEIIAVFEYCANFYFVGEILKISNSSCSQVSISHAYFREGQEIVINFHSSNEVIRYYLTKKPYLNPNSDKIYEITERSTNKPFLIILHSNKESAQFIHKGNFKNGLILSSIDLSAPKKDNEQLKLFIIESLSTFIIENKDILSIGIELDNLTILWKNEMLLKIGDIMYKFQADKSDVLRLLEECRLLIISKIKE